MEVIKSNTDKTLTEKFRVRSDHPIWYYKELSETTVDYVIWNLLKEPFVVDIAGSKHEVTFGKNRKGEIGTCISHDEIIHSKLTSSSVVAKGFREGKWFTITSIDTTDEFKANYTNIKAEHEREENKQWYEKIITDAVSNTDKLSAGQKNQCLLELEDYTYEELEETVTKLFKQAIT